ncbi:MAG: urea carboxylase [Verrucomicrobiota bacterium]|nr:urea carboxylase [Verrucomicrobiota bacterium]
MFSKVLVANRGEIACRIIRTLQAMNIIAVAVYSDADADAEHVALADEAYPVGPADAKKSYLDIRKILAVMKAAQVEAVHPGYGFLSENVEFSAACRAQGIVFIGPEERHILEFGLKHRARALAEAAGVPLVPGSQLLGSCEDALAEAVRIGYPVMLKSTAGGGGIGMRICADAAELEANYETIKRLAENYFKDAGVFLEKYIESSRHIEVQVFGNGRGDIVVLGERDCSVQRRNQKVIEETPAPSISQKTRQALHAAARQLTRAVAYRSAGTVEFIYDVAAETFYFLEVNTRLQVEHGVTEEVFRIDLVRWMVELAAGEDPTRGVGPLVPHGCAMEFRIYAEDPGKAFQPSSGTVTFASFPEDIRCDKWIGTGTEVSAFYDPLLAKVIVSGENRSAVLANASAALGQTRIDGFETNLLLLRQVLQTRDFRDGRVSTALLSRMTYTAATIEVLAPGTQSTVQDLPGRIGYWGVGVPPSGPMDSLNFRLANRLAGNREETAAIEMTLTGGRFRFNVAAVIAMTGGELTATRNGNPVPLYEAIEMQPGDELSIGAFLKGQRAYLAVRGGLDVPAYMGSRSTFILGKFGGHAGRAFVAGDILHIGHEPAGDRSVSRLPEETRPVFSGHWEIGVMYGPQGAPDYFTPDDIATFFATRWEVHFNSSRTGVRLIGPKPAWARSDGGEAGLHPSNIHDNAYAVGAVDFTGDMPVILGPEGPSLGGFVCPATVVEAELWKVGQLRPGDTVRFIPVSLETAEVLDAEIRRIVRDGRGALPEPLPVDLCRTSPVIASFDSGEPFDRIRCRQAGDRYLLMEFGPPQLDLRLRFKVHAWHLEFEEQKVPGIIDITPGIRSLQIHYDNRILPRTRLLALIESLLVKLRENCPEEVESRIVYLPLSWDDSATRLAIEKYTSSVRRDAPWCPSNIEFIRRINGLEDAGEVKDILFNAAYLVMGLGDVYLGAPVATPIDPRHRLVTTKYNPARTWTPENAVGIGGAYLCVYGMEGPGGYQFVGRTVQMWNRYHTTREFQPGKPWLLQCFDQVRFYPVSGDELLQMRRDFLKGRFSLKIEKTVFNINQYNRFLLENQAGIRTFKNRQENAFAAEHQYWKDNDLLTFEEEDLHAAGPVDPSEALEGTTVVSAAVSGSLWKCNVNVGDEIDVCGELAVLESMKMEIPVVSPCGGTVAQIFCKTGDTVRSGQIMCTIYPE